MDCRRLCAFHPSVICKHDQGCTDATAGGVELSLAHDSSIPVSDGASMKCAVQPHLRSSRRR
jgi:hypothetical protein